MKIDDVEVGSVEPCSKCGRDPEVSTGYKGYEGGGPYIITCTHGNGEEVIAAWANRSGSLEQDPMPFSFCCSLDAQRAVDLWNDGNKPASAPSGG